jgi:ribosomal protein L35AE/L33A
MTSRNEILNLPLIYRLYSKGRVLGHKRGKRNTRPNTSLLQIEGVSTKEDAQFYLGKVRTLANFRSLVLCADLMHSHSV